MRALAGHRFGRQTMTFWLCAGVLAGLGWARYGAFAPAVWSFPAILALACGWRSHSWAALAAAIMCGLVLGLARGAPFLEEAAKYHALTQMKTGLTARAASDAVYGPTRQLTFQAGRVALQDGTRLPGKIQLSGFGASAVYEGDEIAASGKLYPGRGAVQAYISYARIAVVRRHPTPINVLRQKFTAGMQTALPPPLSAFAMGLLIGQRSDLPDSVKRDLLMVGLTHIIAVSGYNLTIILHASRRMLAKRSKRLSTMLSFGLIAAFLLLTGASASIVRAAIVSMLSIVSAYYGRSFKPLNLLAIAAAATAWANPFYLWGDLSWYLSFLAFYGVMVVSPLVSARLKGKWHGSVIGQVALETVCAELMSLPIILHSFGQMSLIGLPANVLITSLVPLAMLLSLVAGLGGTLADGLAGWLAWPAQILLNYMLDLAHLMAGLPGIFQQDRSLALGPMLALYGLILLMCFMLDHKTKHAKSAIITDRNVRSQQMVHN